MSTTTDNRNLSTADFAAAAGRRGAEPASRDLQVGQTPDASMHEQGGRFGEWRKVEGVQEAKRAAAVDMDADAGMPPGAAQMPPTAKMPADAQMHQQREQEHLAPLFLPQIAQEFRSRWDEVQIGFVDDPTQAVRQADELVAQVMRNLAQTFAHERSALESELNQGDTEHLRVALRRYRSFFQRLLSL